MVAYALIPPQGPETKACTLARRGHNPRQSDRFAAAPPAGLVFRDRVRWTGAFVIVFLILFPLPDVIACTTPGVLRTVTKIEVLIH